MAFALAMGSAHFLPEEGSAGAETKWEPGELTEAAPN